MVGACLVPLITLFLAMLPDAPSLVARLGWGTAAEREEAFKGLEAMGRESLPALVDALGTPDAEVRSRVMSAWVRIQKGLMVRSTMVRIEGKSRPFSEVVRSIGEQSGFSIVVSQQGPEPVMNAREPQPLPFWEALDRLNLVGGYFDITNPIGPHLPTLHFGGSDDGYPKTISGPFRIKMKGLHDHRDLSLIDGPWLRVDEINQRIPMTRGTKEREARFFVDFGLTIEPRMWFTQEGPARVIEAVDDLGQSLVRSDPTRVLADHSVFYNGGGVTEGQFQLDLAMPDKPGRSIVKLRASVPVAVQVRRPVPALELPLAAGQRKAFTHEDAVFTLQEFQEDDQGTRIDIDVRLNLDRLELPPGRDGEIISSRLRCLADHQVDIVDDRGKVLSAAGGGSWGNDGTGRMSITVWKNVNKERPARLRYYGMLRAFTDVEFEFRNIPLP